MSTDRLQMTWTGPVADFLIDETEQIDLEGAIRSGKTTAALWKVHDSCVAHPGIAWLICRYSDGDTKSKLRPVLERICLEAGTPLRWRPEGRYYEIGNGSIIYAFGVKAQSIVERYAKFRGVTLASIYVDQAEELPKDVYDELIGRLSQQGYPQQILLTPNPMEEDSWLAEEFPVDNRHRHHRYYSVSIYDNARNLDASTLARLERTYPPGHVKHRPMLLGQRGLNVIGRPVYGALSPHQPETAAFQRARHVRPLALDSLVPLCEAIDYGRRHPCVVWAQYTPWTELHVLGGIMGQDLYLEDFAPIVQQYRAQWFPGAMSVQTCCDPSGSHSNSQGLRQNGVSLLNELGFAVRYKDDSNTPDVRRNMIERIAGHMRRPTPRGEAFGIDPDRWLRISATAVTKHPFLADGCEAGYVWDTHQISVGNKLIERPKKDGWYEHGQNCLEYLEHNFGGVQPTVEQTIRRAASATSRALRAQQQDDIDLDAVRLYGRSSLTRRDGLRGRGGY